MTNQPLETALLRTFVTVAEAGSFSRASERLHLTQPTISLRIKRLETLTGVTLFGRNGQGARLTEEGTKLLRYAQRLVALHDEAWSAITAQGISGPVRLGILPDLSIQPFSEALCSFARAHPNVRLEVTEGSNEELRDEVASGQLDLALVAGKISDSTPLFRKEEICWVASNEFSWQKNTPLPLILCHQPCRFREIAFNALDALGIEWQIVFTSKNLLVTKQAVKAGIGVTVRGESLTGDGLINCAKLLQLPQLPTMNIVLERADNPLNKPCVEALSKLIMPDSDACQPLREPSAEPEVTEPQ